MRTQLNMFIFWNKHSVSLNKSLIKEKKMNLIQKAIGRVFRMMRGKKGIYGIFGKGNRFTKGVFMEEAAVVGNYNYFGPYVMLNNVKLGNYCSIAPNVKMGQGVHSKDFVTTYQPLSSSLIGHSLKTTPTLIGNDVWCGANVVIMQGVKVGDGVVIGANAVVTSDIPDYAIAVGIPARVIKYRFDKEVIQTIKDSNWYNYDLIEAKKIISNIKLQKY